MSGNFKTSILLVEDEAIIALKEKKDLENYGYSVHHVNSGEKAVQSIVENSIPFDLILMDINLGPGIDGTQAAELILNHADIPIVFLSSHTEPEVVEKTEKITSYGYVVKNSSITVLDASIKMAMKLSDAKIKHNLKEAALKESENRFFELFERAPLGYQSLDNDGRFLTINQAWLDTLGYNRNEVIGKWFGDFLAPEFVQPFRERFPLFKAQGHIYSEFYMLHKNGEKRFITFDGRVGHHEDGRFKQTHCILKDETERKRIEIELAESLERFRALHNASFGGIGIHDKGIILECNQGLSDMMGYSVDELIGMNGLLLIAPELREMVMNNIVTGYEKPYEAMGLRKNGQQFPIRLEARNVPYQGKMVRTVEFRDLTENKHVQEAFHKSEAIKDKIVSNIGDVIVIIDEKGIIRYKSPNSTRLFGWKPEDLIGNPTWDTIHPEDVESAQNLFKSILSEPGASAKTELRYKRKDGNYVWIEINVINLLHDRDIQGILGDYHDITKRKKAEAIILESEQFLSISQEMAHIGSWKLDLEKNHLSWTNEVYHILGCNPQSFKATYEAFLEYVHPDDREMVHRAYSQSLHDGTDRYDIEHRIVRQNMSDEIRYVHERCIHERNDAGKIIRSMGMVQDITDRKKAEKEIQKQLSEKEALLQEVHHRVKNNISHISALLSLQIDSTKNPEVKEALQEAITRVESMGILYQKLLLTNRYQKISIQSYTESLLDSLNEVFVFQKTIHIEKHITDFEIDANKAVSIGIIMNELLTNVFKYAFKNRKNGIVNLTIGKDETNITLSIHDNGMGFDEKTLNNQSPGFGLTLVKILVEQLNGTYDISNDNGARSVLKFEL